jgi:hypothetical protein
MDDAAGADQVRRWWRRWPDANVGVVTGAVSGLVVLDVDPRHGGDESLAVLEGIHGTLPRTVESLTGGGGQHLYFRHPGTVVPSRSIAPGLDIKGDGGLVVSPPSQHISGRVYRWEPGCAPGEVPLADLPRWLEAVVQDPSLSPSGAGRWHARHQCVRRASGPNSRRCGRRPGSSCVPATGTTGARSIPTTIPRSTSTPMGAASTVSGAGVAAGAAACAGW